MGNEDAELVQKANKTQGLRCSTLSQQAELYLRMGTFFNTVMATCGKTWAGRCLIAISL